MKGGQFPRVAYVLFGVLCLQVPSPIDGQSSSTCTNSMIKLPACHFDKGECGSYSVESMDKGGLTWERVKSNDQIGHDWQPLNKDKRGIFMFLDVTSSKIPVHSKARLNGQIHNEDVKAVCIEFHYATKSNDHHTPVITIYNHWKDGSDHVIGKVNNMTQGPWMTANFETCVGKLSTIAFEGEKLSDSSFVALDYIKVTESNMSCPTTTLATTSTTTAPATTALWLPTVSTPSDGQSSSTCTNSMIKLPACHFDKGDCGTYSVESMDKGGLTWERVKSNDQIGHDWQPSNKDERGYFMSLDVTSSNVPVHSKARLNGQIHNEDVKAVCIEFHYATKSNDHHTPVITIYNHWKDGSDHVIGKVNNMTQGQWMTANFETCVGKLSRIAFESEKLSDSSFVALDHIKITQSNMFCSITMPTRGLTTNTPTTNTPTAVFTTNTPTKVFKTNTPKTNMPTTNTPTTDMPTTNTPTTNTPTTNTPTTNTPTTNTPTTDMPTTNTPTTDMPTTNTPTTDMPTTNTPTTDMPTTNTPTTDMPTTNTPTTDMPTTNTPTTNTPTTNTPTTNTPTTNTPTTNMPTTNTTTTNTPTTNTPTTNTPTTNTTTTNTPTTNAPTTNTPTTNTPTTNTPTTNTPTTNTPTTNTPTTNTPTTNTPTTNMPTTNTPTTNTPTTNMPTTNTPTTNTPAAVMPTTPSEIQDTTISSTSQLTTPTSSTTNAPTTQPPQTHVPPKFVEVLVACQPDNIKKCEGVIFKPPLNSPSSPWSTQNYARQGKGSYIFFDANQMVTKEGVTVETTSTVEDASVVEVDFTYIINGPIQLEVYFGKNRIWLASEDTGPTWKTTRIKFSPEATSHSDDKNEPSSRGSRIQRRPRSLEKESHSVEDARRNGKITLQINKKNDNSSRSVKDGFGLACLNVSRTVKHAASKTTTTTAATMPDRSTSTKITGVSSESTQKGHPNKTGLIVGSVLGVVAAVVILVAVIVHLRRRKPRRNNYGKLEIDYDYDSSHYLTDAETFVNPSYNWAGENSDSNVGMSSA